MLALFSLIAGLTVGCGTKGGAPATASVPPVTQSTLRTYFAGVVSGGYGGPGNFSDSSVLATYTIDDTAKTFAQFTYAFSHTQDGPQMNYSGGFTTLARGLLNFGITYSHGTYGLSYSGNTGPFSYDPPKGGNYAIELAGQGGGLVQLQGMPFVPLVAAASCPDFKSAEIFQFVTIPGSYGSNTAPSVAIWNPDTQTAYGKVSIGTGGSTVKFSGIQQFLSSGTQVATYADLSGDPPAITSLNGVCSPTFYGNTISAPNPLTITNPGANETISPGAIVGIGPGGFLLENNGSFAGNAANNTTGSNKNATYQPFLGAGTGAIGLPQPSSPVDVSSLTGAQYLGVVYGSGTSDAIWSSSIASFGFSTMPSACQSLPPQNGTMVYGGDFPGNNPADPAVQANGGYGNCDFAVDLGSQDSSNNGLFPQATVWVGSGFAGNTTGRTYSFPAVAIAGQMNEKFAVFLIGVDKTGSPNQAWGLYLLQSN
uniref:Uncharacterized protein n=2 Tax=Paracidobacterium acidisoli TaxID=2303751 RepID=A0A372IKA3_9BACT